MPYNDEFQSDAEGLAQAIQGQDAVVIFVRDTCGHCVATKEYLSSLEGTDTPVYLFNYDEREAFLAATGNTIEQVDGEWRANGDISPGLIIDGQVTLPMTVAFDEASKVEHFTYGPIATPEQLMAFERFTGIDIADEPSLSQAALLGSTLAPYESGDAEPSHPTNVRLAEAPSTDVFRG